MKSNEWTATDDKNLKRLLKKFRSLEVADPSHDIQFVANLIEGKEGEEIVSNALLKGEVKRDYRAGETGNVFVEHQSRGKASGIETTEADYQIFILSDDWFDDEVFIGIKTSRLKRILNKITWSVNGGDAKTSKGKLVRLSQLISKLG